MSIYIYDYSDSKIDTLIDLHKSEILKGEKNYYFDTDWEGGPSIIINFSNNTKEKFISDYIKEYIERTWKNDISNEKIKAKQNLYKRNQSKLKQTEKRKNNNYNMYGHGDVILKTGKSNVYNSKIHQDNFFKYRVQLNDIYISMLEKYLRLTYQEKFHLLLNMFIKITHLYEDGSNYGYLSFLSHIQGFFSNIPTINTKQKVLKEFDMKYKEIYSEKFEIPLKIYDEYIAWANAIEKIYSDISQNFSYTNYNHLNYLTIDNQFEAFRKNIAPLNNSFHNSVLEMENLRDFILSPKMIKYRDLVNLFYLSLPLFEISMKNKQFLAYSTVRYYESILPIVEYKFEV